MVDSIGQALSVPEYMLILLMYRLLKKLSCHEERLQAEGSPSLPGGVERLESRYDSRSSFEKIKINDRLDRLYSGQLCDSSNDISKRGDSAIALD